MSISRLIQNIRDGLSRSIISENVYMVSGIESVLDSANLNILFITTEEIGCVVSINGTGNTKIEFFEGTTVSADGSEETLFNMRRSSSETPSTTVFTGPTVLADGTLIHEIFINAGEKNNALGLASSSEIPIILKLGTKYLLRAQNLSGSTTTMSWDSLISENIE